LTTEHLFLYNLITEHLFVPYVRCKGGIVMSTTTIKSPATLYIEKSIRNHKRRKAQLKGRFLLLAIIITVLLVASGFFGKYIAKAQSTEESTNYKYYTQITVSYGDSLWTIAEENMSNEYKSEQAYIKEVIAINNITNADSIIEGQTLIIPYYSTTLK